MTEGKPSSADITDAISAAHRLFDLEIARLDRDIDQCKAQGQNRYVSNLSNQRRDWLRLKAGLPNAAQAPSLRDALIAAKCTSPDGTFVHASMEDVLRAAQPPAAPVGASGIMQAAAKAAEKVANWSPSKREYADRVVGTPAAPVEKDDMTERAKNCTYGNPDCPKCNPAPRSSAERAQALRLLMAEDERQSKLHDLLETIREQIRTGVEPEHRPEGLFKNIQDAVYAMRGRTRLMDDAAITHIFDEPQEVKEADVDGLEEIIADLRRDKLRLREALELAEDALSRTLAPKA